MAKLGINTGSTANDGTGDTLREAGGKINTNFDEVYSTIGDGTNLFTGIVTNITAGNFISISTSFGDVTITGLANTENINAESLVVTGISTLGMVTSSSTLGIGTIFATRVEATGAIIGDTLVGDGSQITGLATTERVVTTSLVVSGLSTVGIVTGSTSIGVDKLYATSLYGDGSNIVGIQYADVAGIATYAPNAGVATYAPNAGVATYAPTSGVSTTSGYADVAGIATHATTAGVSSYTSTWIVGEDPTNNTHYRFTGPGVSTDQDDPELYLVRGEVYRFTNQMGRHPIQIQTDPNGGVGNTYTDGVTGNGVINGDLIFDVQFDAPRQLYYQCTTHNNMGGSIRILNNQSDLADYATSAGVATYATNAGVATYSDTAGIATYSDTAGIATYASNAGVSTYSDTAGIATYATNAGVSTNATYAGYATTAGIATVATTATYASSSGIATYATNAGVATYASTSGVSTTSGYATNAGLSTNATYAGYATTAGIATVATNAQGLTGTPDIEVGYVTVDSGLNVSGVSTLGIVTGATYYGDGEFLTGVVKTNTVQSFDNLVITGVSTLGVVTGVQGLSVNDLYASNVVATNISGDGSGITGVQAEATAGLALDNVYVGAGFTEIDFRYVGEQSTTFTSIGNTAIFTNTILASTADTRSNTLVVTGISTLGVLTDTTSISAINVYANNVTASSYYGDGSGLTGITASGTGVNINDSDSVIGVAGTINFGNNLSVSTVSAGVVTVTASVATASTADVSSDTLVVSGVSTLGVVTGATYYGDGSQLIDGRWTLGASGSDHYTFTGIGFTQTTSDPDLYLARGRVYEFVNSMGAHPFQIQDTQNGSVGTPYSNGVTNNGASNGVVKFEVPFNTPDTLYYQCTSHTGMGGTIFIYPTLR